MSEQEKRRLYIIIAIIIIALILLYLSQGKQSGNGKTVIQNAGDISIPGAGGGYSFGDLPALNYQPGDYSSIGGSKGCALCFAGYERIVTPTPAAPIPALPNPQQIYAVRRASGSVYARAATPKRTSRLW